jgi:hypothetical protein
MTDDATAAQSSTGDASGGGATSASPDDEAKPPSNNETDQRQEPAAKKRRFARWGAVIGQNGAVIAAIIAAMAAVVSAIVAAYTASHTSQAQSHAAAVLAERQEREKLYSDFVTDLYDVDFEVGHMEATFKKYAPPNAGPQQTNNDVCHDPYQKWLDAYRKWIHSAYATKIADSKPVEEVVNRVMDFEFAALEKISQFCASIEANPFADVQPAIGEFDKLISTYGDFEKDFLIAASDDLQHLGYGED